MNEKNIAPAQTTASAPHARLERLGYKLDLAAKNRVCDVIAMGGTIKMAAKIVGCTERAIYYAEARDSAFREKLRACRTEPKFSCLKTMNEAAKSAKTWRAAYYLMKQLHPDRYDRPADMVPIREVRKLIDKLFGAVESTVIDQRTRERIGQRIDKAFHRLHQRGAAMAGAEEL